MGAFKNILFGAVVLAVAFSYQTYRDLYKPQERPELGKIFSMLAEFPITYRHKVFKNSFFFFCHFRIRFERILGPRRWQELQRR